jgi:hypothetical protein
MSQAELKTFVKVLNFDKGGGVRTPEMLRHPEASGKHD